MQSTPEILTTLQREFIGSYKLDWNVTNASKRTGFPLVPCKRIKGYYVYALIDPMTDELFYIGKGKNLRWQYHEKHALNPKTMDAYNELKRSKIYAIHIAGYQLKAIFLATDIDEPTALRIEHEFIKGIGHERLTNSSPQRISAAWLARLEAKIKADRELQMLRELAKHVIAFKAFAEYFLKLRFFKENEREAVNVLLRRFTPKNADPQEPTS